MSQNNTLSGYETTVMFRPDVSDDNQKSFLEKLRGIVASHKGNVILTEDWGRKKLAYPIQKETRGSYHFMVFSGDNKLVAEIERNMRINEGILRFLTVSLGKDFKESEYKRRAPSKAPTDRMGGERGAAQSQDEEV